MSAESRTTWCERWIVVLMSLTALATSWSAYQANIWNGEQLANLTEAEDARILRSEEHLAENQRRMMDGLLAAGVSTALAEGRPDAAAFLVSALSTDLRETVEAWIAADPLHKQSAPRSPLLMPAYAQSLAAVELRQQRLQHTFKERMKTARRAGTAGDNYVLMTVLFAAVLFFGGIASTFKSQRMEIILLSIATVILVLTLAALATLPVLID